MQLDFYLNRTVLFKIKLKLRLFKNDKMNTAIVTILLVIVLNIVCVEGNNYGEECYTTEHKNCFSPDYFVHWSGMKCKYGTRGGYGECWPWFFWWMEVLYVGVGFPVLFGFIGLFIGSFCDGLCGDEDGDSNKGLIGCLVGVAIAWPCCSIPCFCCWCTVYYFSSIKCELCRRKMKSHNCRGNEARTHRERCVEANRFKYDNIPHSPLYKCKKCETHLKLWPSQLLPKSTCTKCDEDNDDLTKTNDDIINTGNNLHVCFTCAATGDYNFHHLCSRHGTEGTITEVDWKNLAILPRPPSNNQPLQSPNYGKEGQPLIESQASTHPQPQPSTNALPPGWKVVTNPVTGEPYGLCDPSGEIKPLIDNKSMTDTGIPPPLYDEAFPSAPPSQYSCNENPNRESSNWMNKTQRMMRQTSIEMDAMARKFKQ